MRISVVAPAARATGPTSPMSLTSWSGARPTPRVRRCGIAGIARAWLLAQVADCAEADLTPAEVGHADALFLCNSVRGIQPVRRLGLIEWPPDERIAQLSRRLAEAQPAFAPASP